MRVIIPCSGQKLQGRHKARHLYQGLYFKGCLRAALALTEPENIFVLSGKYGLLPLEQEVESYEQRINPSTMTPVVVEQAKNYAEEPNIRLLLPRDYASVIMAVWPHAVNEFDGASGIGVQLGRCKQIVDRRQSSLFEEES